MIPAVHVLIPAAGSSSRLGTNKQLVKYEGKTLLCRAVEQAFVAGIEDITVVTGFQAAAAEASLHGLGCRIVHNEDWEVGLGSSLALGVASLPAATAAVLVLLPDQFQVTAEYVRFLLAQHILAPKNLVASSYGDVVGVPAIFPARVFGEFAALVGLPGAKPILQKHRSETLVHACPEAAFDLDTPADLSALRSRAGSRARRDAAPLL